MSFKSHDRPLQAVLFDLDGTLLDTAPDMVGALNRLRVEHGLPELAFATFRPYVSHGSLRLVREGFPDRDVAQHSALQRRFLDIYFEHLHHGTRLFPDVEDVLDALARRAVPIGIVTNKPGWLTTPLLARLGLDTRFACVVSGDTLPTRKPHPNPLLHAARLARAQAPCCIYVGDAERDIQAARAAGMRSLIARYGYLAPEDQPDTWQADGDIHHPAELLSWLKEHARL
ncbi:MAG: phosphoglycolate phosphatase [Proteobacteria bacterium]|nr:phosphoglycolate phosphatase [Pseudomonadota bacterium]